MSADWSVREADGVDDAFYLQRLWHHWFGAEYDSQETLSYDLFGIAGWETEEEVEWEWLDTFGVIAEHHHPTRDHSVRIGGAIVLVIDHNRTTRELQNGTFDADVLAGERNGWLLFSAVDEAWRGRGIGRELTRRRLEWIDTTAAEMAFALGWERGSAATSRPLLDAAGFIPVERIDEAYAKHDRAACPDCGVWPCDDRTCTCDATVWALDLPRG